MGILRDRRAVHRTYGHVIVTRRTTDTAEITTAAGATITVPRGELAASDHEAAHNWNTGRWS